MADGGGGEGGEGADVGGWGRYIRSATQYYTTGNQPREPGTRRKRFMQVASSVANNYYLGYSNRSGELDSPPEMGDTNSENQQLWLFPSYAREVPPGWTVSQSFGGQQAGQGYGSRSDGIVCEVNVNGWVFTPHVGVHGRKTRWQMGLIRWMCGLSNQTPSHPEDAEGAPTPEQAEAITSAIDRTERSQCHEDNGLDASPEPTGRYSWRPGASEAPQPAMSAAQLRAANEVLEHRIAPFTYIPVKGQPVTVFFYDITNDTQAQSRFMSTMENGHFSCSAALPFIPSHVRVLASEALSATELVKVYPFDGISIISDIDDTVKNSGIMLGAREMAKATFIAPVRDLVIEGVADWYKALVGPPYNCSMHYISNSPWQLYPVLRSFFDETGLPTGSFHLKHYVGMLQGVLEPAADRKRGTVERVMQDFPHRKWLLIGDSGEADLEVYTEMVERWPDRVLAVCIRDITTREYPLVSFSDLCGASSDGKPLGENPRRTRGQRPGYEPNEQAPLPPPRPMPRPSLNSTISANPPARPEKPASLRGSPIPKKPASLRHDTTPWAASSRSVDGVGREVSEERPPPPPPPRRAATAKFESRQVVPSPRPPPQRMTTAAPVMGEFRTAAPPRTPQWVATTNTAGDTGADLPPPRTKLELAWERRWQVAKEKLEQRDVRLLSWRVGSDLKNTTREIVERELRTQQGGRADREN